MAEEVAALVVRLEATQARFERDMQRAESAMRRSAGGIERRAVQMVTRVDGAFSRLSRGGALQQVGFQIGDFATQIASGQSALVAFTQQGTQLVSGFGPWGAAIGAAGAVVGALAASLLRAGDASDEMAASTDNAVSAASGLEGAIGGLEGVVDAYADAIAGTASAQVGATDTIVAQTKREFDAKKQLLELERARSAALLESTRADAAKLQSELDAVPKNVGSFIEQQQSFGALSDIPEFGQTREQAQRAVEQAAGALFTEQAKERLAKVNELQTGIKRTTAEAELLAVALERTDKALSMSFEDMVAQREAARGGGGRGREGGGGGGGAPERRDTGGGELDALRDRVQLLDQEQSLIGLTEAATVRKSAAYERERIVAEALNKIRQEGREPTQAEIDQAAALGDEFERLTVANYDMQAAMKSQADAAADAKRSQEALAQGIVEVSDRFTSAIQQADSFADALKNIGLELVNLAVHGLAGQGPFASLLGNVLPSLFGTAVGAAAGGFSAGGAAPSSFFAGQTGTLSFSAKGNAFHGGNIIPFARGGIVTRPTMFPMARGAGLMGEAGPEAVLPLRRGPGGRLGVEAGGGSVNITIVNEDRVGVSVRTEQRQTPNGPEIRTIIDKANAANIHRGGSATSRALSARGNIVNR